MTDADATGQTPVPAPKPDTAVRATTDRGGVTLEFTADAWRQFTCCLRS